MKKKTAKKYFNDNRHGDEFAPASYTGTNGLTEQTANSAETTQTNA